MAKTRRPELVYNRVIKRSGMTGNPPLAKSQGVLTVIRI